MILAPGARQNWPTRKEDEQIAVDKRLARVLAIEEAKHEAKKGRIMIEEN